jgi:hypothetical protein
LGIEWSKFGWTSTKYDRDIARLVSLNVSLVYTCQYRNRTSALKGSATYYKKCIDNYLSLRRSRKDIDNSWRGQEANGEVGAVLSDRSNT